MANGPPDGLIICQCTVRKPIFERTKAGNKAVRRQLVQEKTKKKERRKENLMHASIISLIDLKSLLFVAPRRPDDDEAHAEIFSSVSGLGRSTNSTPINNRPI
jgi:hypothetical protein